MSLPADDREAIRKHLEWLLRLNADGRIHTLSTTVTVMDLGRASTYTHVMGCCLDRLAQHLHDVVAKLTGTIPVRAMLYLGRQNEVHTEHPTVH